MRCIPCYICGHVCSNFVVSLLVQVIPSWYQRKGYVGAMADLIAGELEKFSRTDEAEIFFSAHGVPKSYGKCHCMASILCHMRHA